ncbi:MAG: glycosyltransferase [Rhodocyclaceae bacterium]|nr:glycosyltransferase [Rhodocyclaceae bacterium]
MQTTFPSPSPQKLNRPLRVLMLSDVYFPRINGVSTSIETFRTDLQQHDVDVDLIAPHYPAPHPDCATVRVASSRLPFDPEDRLMHWPTLKRATDELEGLRFDLIHIQTPFAAHYAGVRMARRCNVPVMATYHTHFEEYIHHYLPFLPRAWLAAAARRMATHQCNALNAVVVPSQAMHETLTNYGVSTPLHVLPTGIPVGNFGGGDGARFRARYHIPLDRSVALFVGRVAYEKNIGFLIDALRTAVKLQPNLLLMIAGEGPALPALRRQVKSCGLENHVCFVGYLDRKTELPDCYAAADVFVFASLTETQGLVLIEAMAAGLPVFALAAMGTCDILKPQRGAVIASKDPIAFAHGLVMLISNRYRLNTLSAEARDYALEWAAPERAKHLAGLYRSLIGCNV